MLLALLGFSTLPLISSVIGQNKSVSSTVSASTTSLASDRQARLEAEALGYQLVLEREPDNQTALGGLLEARLKQGDIQGAIEPLTKLAELNPQQTDYTILLAQTQAYIGDTEGAGQTYLTLLASQPGNIPALQGIVNLRLQQDHPQDAIALLKDTLNNATRLNSAQPDTVDVVAVQLLLGQVYATQKSYAEAIAVYDQAAQIDEEDFRPILAKALVLQEQGKNGEAQPLFETAATLAPPTYQEQIKAMATSIIQTEEDESEQ